MITKKIFLFLIITPAAFGAPLSNHLNFDVSAKSRWSDNANKENKEENIFTERQDQYSFQVDGTYNNEWISAKSQYDLSQLKFSKNSQPDDSVLTGKGELIFGSVYQPFSLMLEHSSDVLLNAPDALDLTTNRDERATLIVKPSFHHGFNEANQFLVSASRTDINYKKLLDRNLVTDEFEVIFLHKFNAVDEVRIIGSSGKTEFDIYPTADYKLQSALLEYSASLRKLKYSVAAGGNRLLQNDSGDEFSSPEYLAKLSYTNTFNIFSFSFNQSLSDSSSSAALIIPTNGINDADSVISKLDYGIGVVKVTTAAISWNATSLCERCTTDLTISDSTEKKLQLNTDSTIGRISARFSYKLGRFSSFDVFGSSIERKFDYLNRFGRSREVDLKMSYRAQLMNHIWFDSFFTRRKAETDESNSNYIENIIGFRLSADF